MSCAREPGRVASGRRTRGRRRRSAPRRSRCRSTLPFVIHIFVPFRIQSSPSRFADVRIEPGSLPSPAPTGRSIAIASPLAIFGSHSSFCSSLPNAWIAYTAERSSAPTRTTGDRCRRPRSRAPPARTRRSSARASTRCRAASGRSRARRPPSRARARGTRPSRTSPRPREGSGAAPTRGRRSRICFSSSERRWSMSIRSVGFRSDGLTNPNVPPDLRRRPASCRWPA